MVDETDAQKLRERYSHVHPWIFNRSCEYAKSLGDLFDILEDLPQTYPIIWDDQKKAMGNCGQHLSVELKGIAVNPLQEYYLRNQVRAPYVFYGSGKVILFNPCRQKSCDRYKLLELRAINKDGNDGANVGKFDLIISVPHKSTSSIFIKDDEWSVYWQEYEEHILKKVGEWRSLDWQVIVTAEELKLACWELVAYSQDEKFAKLPFSLLDLNYGVFDCNNPVVQRLSIIDKLIEYMILYSESTNNYIYKAIISSWSELSSVVNSPKYAHWLARLVKR